MVSSVRYIQINAGEQKRARKTNLDCAGARVYNQRRLKVDFDWCVDDLLTGMQEICGIEVFESINGR